MPPGRLFRGDNSWRETPSSNSPSDPSRRECAKAKNDAAATIQTGGIQCHICDVTDVSSFRAVLGTIQASEGRIDVFHQANDRTKDYYWKFHSTIDVTSIRPLLETNQQPDGAISIPEKLWPYFGAAKIR